MKSITLEKRAASRPVSWSDLSDEELLSQYQKSGVRHAFDELVHRYERELFNYLRRYLGDASLAEDAFQATFFQIHLKCEQFEEGRKVRPWLYTIATNQAIDAQRRNKRYRLVSLDRRQGTAADEEGTLLQVLQGNEAEPTELLDNDERRHWMQDAVTELPGPLQSAVTLIYYQGLKYREAADILGVPVGTVKSRLHSAILKLNASWNKSHSADDQARPLSK
ncbi:MAG: RNA polymerase sigma factor [Planctomycetes bacterium]|nr:RNA polymerase sigma factor [Planctomycetota bacterium]